VENSSLYKQSKASASLGNDKRIIAKISLVLFDISFNKKLGEDKKKKALKKEKNYFRKDTNYFSRQIEMGCPLHSEMRV